MTRLLMTADALGGVWPYALELAGALAPHGYRTILATLGPPPSQMQRDAARAIEGLRLIDTGLPLDWLAEDEDEVHAAARGIATLAEQERADLIQLNQSALAAEPMPAPAVAVIHSCVATWWQAVGEGALPESFAWQTALVRAGLAAADQVVCPSAAFAAAIADAYHLGRLPTVVHNGRSPRLVGASAIHDFALTAGRLWDKGKNVATLDRAAARIGVPIKAAGALTSPAGETIALEHVHAMGLLGDEALARCYAARPVFVSAALYEPFGLAVLEAAQAGCPLVLSDIPTFRELWSDVAIFVEPNDADGYARAIEYLIGDTAARLSRGDMARRRATRFTPAATAAGMAAIYDALRQRVAA